MRDQIITGITNALTAAPATSTLNLLSSDDYLVLAESILRELATLPENTPPPTIVAAPAAPVLLITPADVIADAAQNALHDVTVTRASHDATGMDPIIDSWSRDGTARTVREFLFRVQVLFGVRVRSTRSGTYLIAGNRDQVRALQRTMMFMDNLAAPLLANMTTDEQREFWATLGEWCIAPDNNPNVEALIESNRDNCQRATAALVAEYGPARTLARTEAVTSGDVFDAAYSTFQATQQSGVGLGQ